MNKAKAFFSGAMILVVAGASGVLWCLNDQGIIGNNDVTEPDAYIEYDENYYHDDVNEYGNSGNSDDKKTEKATNAAEDNIDSKTDESEINDFLSIFTRVYFSEDSAYSLNNRSTYELIRFAYSHIKQDDSSRIETRKIDDPIGYYNCVSAVDVNNVLEKYLGVTVPNESVYTENDYSFFKYSDGEFMCPAADGLPFTNIAVADEITETESLIKVSFTVYSGDENYAEGKAEIEKKDNEFILSYYSLKK